MVLRNGLPIAPGALPLVGHVAKAYRGMPDLVRRARAEVGPLFWINAFGTWLLLCTGPGAAGLLKSSALSSRHLQRLSPLVAGESLLAHDGDAHRRIRSATHKPFSPRGLSATAVGWMSAQALTALVEGWVERGSARVLPDVQESTLQIIFRMLGAEPSALPTWRKQYRALLLANLGFNTRFPGSPAWRAARAKKWIDARFAESVAVARAGRGDPGGLLTALACAEDDEGRRLGEGELVDNLRLLVLGGHETISSTMAWMAIALATNPDAWDALVAEASAAGEVPMTLEAARRFPFAEAVFRETVRLHPPFGAITRVADEDVAFAGKVIPNDTLVAIDLHSASRDGNVFSDPDAFKPSRWLDRSGPPTQLEVIQFGIGPHFCLGYHLAWLEAVQFAVALAKAASSRRARPRGAEPRPIYLPTEHPPPGTRVVFAS